MRTLLPLLSLSAVAQALYFYIDGNSPKCFFEELPKDTLVVGHYTAEEWDDHRNMWMKHDGLNVFISVDVRCIPSLLLCHRPFSSPRKGEGLANAD
jgi:p24 family protein alpha